MRIFKYIPSPHTNAVRIPKSAEVLCVREQHGRITVWAKVDPDETETRDLRIVGTGWECNYEKYVGTAFVDGLVWHLFEEN